MVTITHLFTPTPYLLLLFPLYSNTSPILWFMSLFISVHLSFVNVHPCTLQCLVCLYISVYVYINTCTHTIICIFTHNTDKHTHTHTYIYERIDQNHTHYACANKLRRMTPSATESNSFHSQPNNNKIPGKLIYFWNNREVFKFRFRWIPFSQWNYVFVKFLLRVEMTIIYIYKYIHTMQIHTYYINTYYAVIVTFYSSTPSTNHHYCIYHYYYKL